MQSLAHNVNQICFYDCAILTRRDAIVSRVPTIIHHLYNSFPLVTYIAHTHMIHLEKEKEKYLYKSQHTKKRQIVQYANSAIDFDLD